LTPRRPRLQSEGTPGTRRNACRSQDLPGSSLPTSQASNLQISVVVHGSMTMKKPEGVTDKSVTVELFDRLASQSCGADPD